MRRLPYQGVATLAVGVVVPAGGSPLRAPCSRLPLRVSHYKRLPPLRAGRNRPCPRAAVAPKGGAFARRHRPLRASLASLSGWPWSQPTAPLQGALATAWPWVVDPAWGLVVAGRPSSSLPSLRKRSKNA
ncbi:hypothetical protein GW17_00050929 [Ensete ventricosum]|nr:hypothetical protein GW17_00050929 [Ensete ventricosum]